MRTLTTNGLSLNYTMHPYARPFAKGGGFIFLAHIEANYHVFITKIDATTLDIIASVDLGYTGIDDFHIYPHILIDPTDNKLVVVFGGRVNIPLYLFKSNYEYGGRSEQFTADNWTRATVTNPLKGLPCYNIPTFFSDGTLSIYSSLRYSTTNGTPSTLDGVIFKSVGNGTTRTAYQLASGSWTPIAKPAPDDVSGNAVMSPAVYPDKPLLVDVNGTERVYLPMHLFRNRDTGTTSDRWGFAVIYSDDKMTTWKKMDGTPYVVGTTMDAAQRSDTTLWAWADSCDYVGDICVYDGEVYVSLIKFVLTPDYSSYVSTETIIRKWNGIEWETYINLGGSYFHPALLSNSGFYLAAHTRLVNLEPKYLLQTSDLVANRLFAYDSARNFHLNIGSTIVNYGYTETIIKDFELDVILLDEVYDIDVILIQPTSKLYLGTQEVKKLYLGTQEVINLKAGE